MYDSRLLINSGSYTDEGFYGDGAVVAVLDSGFDVTHPIFQDRLLGTMRMTDGSADVTGVSNLHGTLVASIVAQIAPSAKLLLVNVAMSSGVNGAGLVAAGLDYARQWVGPRGEKVRIINMSFGTPTLWVGMRDAVYRAYDAGILLVAAAGNDGDGDPGTDEKAYPAYWTQTLSVGAFGIDGDVRSNSNSNIEVDLLAPGQNVKAANLSHGYSSFSGTSAAAPCVSGAAALLYEYLTKKLGRYPTEGELRAEILSNLTLAGLSTTDPRQVGGGKLYMGYQPFTPPVPEDIDVDFMLDEYRRRDILDSPQLWKDHFDFLRTAPYNSPDYKYRFFELAFKKQFHHIQYRG